MKCAASWQDNSDRKRNEEEIREKANKPKTIR